MSAPPALPPPRRVVSLVPSLTESLFDLDLGDRLIAVSDYCTRPAERLGGLPRVGGPKTPDVARIVALQPDLVLLNDEENRREDAKALAAAGIPLWVTVLDALTVLWQIMELFDHTVMIPRVREIERAYDYTLAAALASAPVRVFVPIWRDPWMTFSAGTYADDMLRVCGGANVFAAGARDTPTRYPQITLNDVIAAQPEVILLPDEPYPFNQGDAAELSRLDLPAARFGRIYSIDGSLLMWHGTRAAYALRDLPLLLMGGTSS